MTKNDFFNLSKSERKYLIAKAHPYYCNGWANETYRIPEDDIKEFIDMCNLEREK